MKIDVNSDMGEGFGVYKVSRAASMPAIRK